jgi:hypothetical protein
MIGLRLTIALAVAAAVWPAGAHATIDQRLPVPPKAEPEVAVSAPQDLRSPDARDGGQAPKPSATQDLRSPDARDADRGAAIAAAQSARVAPGRSGPSVSDGFEWDDAAIGAAVTFALVSVAGGTLLLVARRRHRTPTT